MNLAEKIKISHLHFATARGVNKTYCPSEVAREVFVDDWPEQMELVRRVADTLVENGTLLVLQHGVIKKELPSKLKGPIRLKLHKGLD